MRLFIDDHYFISIIPEGDKFNCQIMELIHGIGMYGATITENQEDVISCIVSDTFKVESKICKDLQELFGYHEECIKELTLNQ